MAPSFFGPKLAMRAIKAKSISWDSPFNVQIAVSETFYKMEKHFWFYLC